MSWILCSACNETKKIPEIGPRKKDRKASKKGKENIEKRKIKIKPKVQYETDRA